MAHLPSNLASLQTAASQGCLILPGQEQTFLDLELSFRQSLKPAAGIETQLFYDALHSSWNIHRCRMAELHIYRSQADPTLDPHLDDSNDKRYNRIRQFERSSRLSLHKSLQQLAAIQTEVRYRLQTFPPREGIPSSSQLPHNLSVLCNTGKVLDGALKTRKPIVVEKTAPAVATNPEDLTSIVNSAVFSSL